jgi:peptidyl-prolyl cis-trans isomerase SurA
VFKIKSLCAVVALSAAPLVAAEELSETGDFLDGVAAIVNDGIVLKSQYYETLDQITNQAKTEGWPLPPDDILQQQVLERVILIQIQMQRADMIGLEVSDQMLNQVIAGIAQQRDISFEDLPRMLAADGINYQDFRRQMRQDVTLEQLRRIDVIQRIRVSTREIQNCIADIEDNVVLNSDYNLSHILLSLPESASSEQIDDIVDIAQDIYERASDGADFRALAVRFSQGPTALQGGALGWLKGEQVPTVFTDILAPLKAGDVSEPLRTASSIHIVKVNDMRGAVERSEEKQVSARHILITPNEIIGDETARQQLMDAYERIRDGEDFGELAKLLSDDPSTSNSGGELGWAGPGSFVPEFQATIDTLEIGEMSEPFRSQFGWHVVEVLDRRTYDNTEDLKEENCALRIRNGKTEEETQLWARRLRDEAYVDIRM